METYGKLARLCEERGLHLELHVGCELLGTEKAGYRELTLLEVRTGDGKNQVDSERITPPADVFDAARAIYRRMAA